VSHPTCTRKGCDTPTDHLSGYCTDTCLRADHTDLLPVIALARNKTGGFGRDIHWMARTPVKAHPTEGDS
jgi:hypothetical protein